MEAFMRSAIHMRCLNHIQRTRILGIRSLRTRPQYTSKPQPAPSAATNNSNDSGRTPETSQSKPDNPPKIQTETKAKADDKPITTTSPALLTLQPQTLHSYTTSPAPTAAQLTHSNSFFQNPPNHLWTAAYFRQFPSSAHSEVAFLGRSNVGKSSLLNAIFNRPRARTAHVSKKPGRTKTMNAFGVGPETVDIAKDTESWKALGKGGLVVVDMPGYGKGSREEWGAEIMKYLEKRKQLRKTFLLIDVEHGPKQTDLQLLAHLQKSGIQHQIILSKADKLLFPSPKPPSPQKLHNSLLKLHNTIADIKGSINQPNADVLCVSSEKDMFMAGMPKAGRLGVDAVRWAVLRACGLDCDEQGRPRHYETFAAAPEPAPGIKPEVKAAPELTLGRKPELERQDKVERLVSWKA